MPRCKHFRYKNNCHNFLHVWHKQHILTDGLLYKLCKHFRFGLERTLSYNLNIQQPTLSDNEKKNKIKSQAQLESQEKQKVPRGRNTLLHTLLSKSQTTKQGLLQDNSWEPKHSTRQMMHDHHKERGGCPVLGWFCFERHTMQTTNTTNKDPATEPVIYVHQPSASVVPTMYTRLSIKEYIRTHSSVCPSVCQN